MVTLKKEKIKKESQPEWLKKEIEDRATRHEEVMSIRREFTSSFSDYVQFLKNKDNENKK